MRCQCVPAPLLYFVFVHTACVVPTMRAAVLNLGLPAGTQPSEHSTDRAVSARLVAIDMAAGAHQGDGHNSDSPGPSAGLGVGDSNGNGASISNGNSVETGASNIDGADASVPRGASIVHDNGADGTRGGV